MKQIVLAKVYGVILISLLLSLSFCSNGMFAETLASANKSKPGVQYIEGKRIYAVVVSRATYGNHKWKNVVEALQKKYDASVIIYPNSIAGVRKSLAEVFPRYVCFVARPEEAGRDFVVSVHRITRTLDDDPYTDVLWGILTGYDAKDALRIAQREEPLIIRRAAAGTSGLNLNMFVEGIKFSEGEKGVMWEKRAGGKVEKKKCPDDSTKAIVDTLNNLKPDLFLTSGHATMRDWQIGYSYKNGQFRCKNGQLFGLDMEGKVYPINSPNPKVYLPLGNCLIGQIPDRNCMALAYMHTGGVYQMVGYVVSTWYGYGGWGVGDLFIGQPGRYTLAEAFYFNNQSLIYQLETRFPRSARVDFDRFDIEREHHLIEEMFRKHNLRDNDEKGLLWDRDTVAFYGDPAWEARLEPHPLAWEQKLSEKDGIYTFEITANRDTAWSRPPMILFPHRIKDIKVIEGKELSPVITDNFLLLPTPKKFEKGKCYRVVFKAVRISGT